MTTELFLGGLTVLVMAAIVIVAMTQTSSDQEANGQDPRHRDHDRLNSRGN